MALLGTDPVRLLTAPVVVADVAVACALEVGDGLAYNGIAHPQSLSSAWPLAAVMTAGIAFRAPGGVVAGAAIGLARGVGELLGPTAWTDLDTVSVVSSIVLYALAGLVAGFVTARLREAEHRISLARACEEVARTLHDGVLQTLAVVQRRTEDPDIVRLAHEQERELREFLFGTPGTVGAAATRARGCGTRPPGSSTATAAPPRSWWPPTPPRSAPPSSTPWPARSARPWPTRASTAAQDG